MANINYKEKYEKEKEEKEKLLLSYNNLSFIYSELKEDHYKNAKLRRFMNKIRMFFVTMWYFTKSGFKLSSEYKAEARYSICQTCPRFKESNKTCKLCSCFMELKTKIDSAKCPIDKW